MKNKKDSRFLETSSVIVLDMLSMELSFLLGYWLWVAYPWHGNYQPLSVYWVVLWALPVLSVVVFNAVGLYKSESGIMAVEEQSKIFKALWITYGITFATSFFYRNVDFSRLVIFYSIFIALVIVSFERYCIRLLWEWNNQRGTGVKQAVIYGAGYHGQRLERWIKQSPKLGIMAIGYLDDDIERLTKKPEKPPFLGDIEELKWLKTQKNVELLFIAHGKLEERKVAEIFQYCRELEIKCWAIPSLYQFHIERAELTHIGGIPLMGFRTDFGKSAYVPVKATLDFICAVIGLMVASPLFVIIALMIRFSTKETVLFRQTRIGLNGKKFRMYKFRTLKKSKQDDEISPEITQDTARYLFMGNFLRRSGLDELPQLFNVFNGDMSLVGPRPEMPFIVERYGPLEKERLTVKPGVTGLWQISGDRKKLLIHENMDYDLFYIGNLSFNLDLAICLQTFFILLKRLIRPS